jgi:hypothetical protein
VRFRPDAPPAPDLPGELYAVKWRESAIASAVVDAAFSAARPCPAVDGRPNGQGFREARPNNGPNDAARHDGACCGMIIM